MLETVSPGSDALHQPHLRVAGRAAVCGRDLLCAGLTEDEAMQRYMSHIGRDEPG